MCVLSLRMCKYILMDCALDSVGVLHTPYKCLNGDIVIANIIESYIYIMYIGLYVIPFYVHVIVLICGIYAVGTHVYELYTCVHARTCQRFVFAFAFVSKTEKDNVVGGGCTSSEFNIDWWTVVQLATWLKCFIIILLLVLYKARKWNEHSWRSLHKKSHISFADLAIK